MSYMKHTPGPWQVAGCRQKIAMNGVLSDSHIVGPDTVPVAAVFYSYRKTLHSETLANARLIAAAPDLLAALVCLIPQTFTGDFKRSAEIAHWEHERDLGNEYAPFVLAAFAAIAKATGAG